MEPRSLVYQCLCAVMLEKEYSNLVLRRALKQLDIAQRPFATQLFYGTLEHARYVRYQWEEYPNKMPKELIAVLLDMAVYELFWMQAKPYALIDESVKLAKRYAYGASGMINAILRKVEKRGMRALPDDHDEALSIETSHPLWLIKMWNAQYGADICERICHENMQTHLRCARVNTLKISKAELLQADSSFTSGAIAENSVYYHHGNPADTKWYQEGYITVQDEASQLVASFLDPQPHERILDVCSAPGTKATHMAERMQDQGEIICGDIHEHRVELIKAGAQRLGLTCIQACCMDACVLEGLSDASFDRVLCDVPCSGYGTLGHKSDIKYHMQSSDMDTLIPLQAAILKQSAQMVKPGGMLVYSTCTLNKKENEKQIAAFLATHDDYTLIQEQTIFPFTYGSDGFYMAKLQRK